MTAPPGEGQIPQPWMPQPLGQADPAPWSRSLTGWGEARPAAAGRLTQLGAGADVSFPAPNDVIVLPLTVVSKPTTRMSPAGMPCALTVTEPPIDRPD